MIVKEVLLIRHGESQGQTAKSRGLSRKDPILTDCGLSRKGEKQAISLQSQLQHQEFDLICTSPLTRAMTTCVLGLGKHAQRGIPFVCHPDLAEIGGSIPENIARPVKNVVRDVKRLTGRHAVVDAIDFSNIPAHWPNESNESFPLSNGESFKDWLFRRPERRVAVVCHHNVITRKLLPLAPFPVKNCAPILCVMLEDASLQLASERSLNINMSAGI
eukprot:CAMPEP_0195507040 /NCGR_PEP_ID=MMETSP0794_2-20130614/567_1 /TAXON_ID=515487 /ORGANISM="Stephanopyxis turris, Strain CCMP 815" /LENGTH=216 /DNA_ID=CAMNT_0040633577 /DNA_START=38 /DNA_END=688 /DNA_ORIENTATION=-